MKKITYLVLLVLFCMLANQSFAQRINMTPGAPIVLEVIKQRTLYKQDGKLLKFNNMCKTLSGYEVCAENMALAHKHGVNSGILLGVGVLTFPIGYAIIIVPFINQKKKQIAYVEMGIDEYNKYLASIGGGN
jgi:hypothetical protein